MLCLSSCYGRATPECVSRHGGKRLLLYRTVQDVDLVLPACLSLSASCPQEAGSTTPFCI